MPSAPVLLDELSSSVPCWRFGRFEIDLAAATLRRGKVEVPLRRQTWKLLVVFAANAGRLCSKHELMAALWPRSIVVDDSLVQCVGELRQALGDADRHLVRTVPRQGYRFDVDLQPVYRDPSLPHRSDAPIDDRLAGVWQSLARAQDAIEVDQARQLFESGAGETCLRADAMAGVAMSHVIELLNRWTHSVAWSIAVAREAAEESIALEPGSARACHARAHVALIQGRHVEAFLGFRAALARDPTMARARLRLGVIELEMGHAERTARYVRQALDGAERDVVLQAQAFFVQGMALFHLGLDRESSLCMARVLSLRPASGLAHQWLAAIDALQEQEHSSAAHLAAFCQHVPGHTIESLRATERSTEPVFLHQRERFYDGLRRAGLD